jgi:hypothetical protein
LPSSFFRRRLGRKRFGLFDKQHKSRSIFHGDIGKHFAIELHTRSFQAMNQLAVSDAIQTCGSADALNPQPAILPLLDATIAKCVTIGAIRGFLRRLVQLALGEEKTFCPFEILLAPCTALGTAFYASHRFAPLAAGLTRREPG